MMAFLTRITGIQKRTEARHRKEDTARDLEHRRQVEALERKHDRERVEHGRGWPRPRRCGKREKRSLETALRREDFQKFAGTDRGHEAIVRADEMKKRQAAELAARRKQEMQQQVKDDFRKAARPGPCED